jgi:hypothetical protein
MGQEYGVYLGYAKVIGLDRNGIENCGDEALALGPPAPFCQLNADPQLCHRDHRNGDVVAVTDRIGQCVAAALGIDQDRRVEDQPCQGSVTGSIPSRSSRSSSAQASSG